jgi:hypothetical protein
VREREREREGEGESVRSYGDGEKDTKVEDKKNN